MVLLKKKLEVNIYNIVTSEQMDIWGHSVSLSFLCCVLSLPLARRIWNYSKSSVSEVRTPGPAEAGSAGNRAV